MDVLRKLFYRFEWNIAVRTIENDADLPVNSRKQYDPMPRYPMAWFADPFLFSQNGKIYLFFERMNMRTHRGRIGYCELSEKGNRFGKPKDIISEPFHLS